MKIIWWETLLVVLIPILIMLLYSGWQLNKCDPTINYTVDKFIKNAKNGDLVFLKYRSIYSKLIKIYSGECWSHCGFVYNGSIIEIADYPDTNHSHYCSYPIDEWLELNSDRLCGYSKWLGPDLKNDPVNDSIIQKYKHVKLDMNMFNWIRVKLNKKYTQVNVKDCYFCSEFIITLLAELKMYKPIKMPFNYTPGDITRLPQYDKLLVFEI
jgi:hypothetical protein